MGSHWAKSERLMSWKNTHNLHGHCTLIFVILYFLSNYKSIATWCLGGSDCRDCFFYLIGSRKSSTTSKVWVGEAQSDIKVREGGMVEGASCPKSHPKCNQGVNGAGRSDLKCCYSAHFRSGIMNLSSISGWKTKLLYSRCLYTWCLMFTPLSLSLPLPLPPSPSHSLTHSHTHTH